MSHSIFLFIDAFISNIPTLSSNKSFSVIVLLSNSILLTSVCRISFNNIFVTSFYNTIFFKIILSFYFTRKAAYNGTDFIPFSNPKFFPDILIEYLGLNCFI